MFRVINNSKNGGVLILSSKTFWSCKFLVLQETLYFFKITMCQRKCLLFLVTFSILLTNCYTARFLHNDLKHMKLLARYTRRCVKQFHFSLLSWMGTRFFPRSLCILRRNGLLFWVYESVEKQYWFLDII